MVTPTICHWTKNHPCRPASVYGRTKYMAEQILTDWCRARPESSNVPLRYFNPVGAHASGRIGEDPQGIPNNLMPFIAQVAVGRREKLAIFGDDYDTRDGTGMTTSMWSTSARAHVAALNYSQDHTGTEIFNIGTGDGTTVKEMLAAYARASGRALPMDVTARRPGDIAACYAGPRQGKAASGWNAN